MDLKKRLNQLEDILKNNLIYMKFTFFKYESFKYFLMDEPIRLLPHKRDLVTDVSWNYEINQHILPLKPKPMEADGTYRIQQKNLARIQEFHKCIE